MTSYFGGSANESCWGIALDKLKMYIDYGADPEIKNKQGKSAMDMANEIGDKALIELFKPKK
ncbi:MAG: hypothetical protein NTV01_13485 [Bacteroidia bacterium]|nr:hypothetical protein [Bacteroidia bacterium]